LLTIPRFEILIDIFWKGRFNLFAEIIYKKKRRLFKVSCSLCFI